MWLFGWLVGWLVGWSVGRPARRLSGWLPVGFVPVDDGLDVVAALPLGVMVVVVVVDVVLL